MIQINQLVLIGISGAAGAGKDTVGKIFQEHFLDCYTKHFADPLKQACSSAFGIPLDDFSDPLAKNLVHPYWDVTPRQIAQFVGTEMFRVEGAGLLGPKVANSFWTNRMAGTLTGDLYLPEVEGLYEEDEIIIIPDVRFQNEYDFVLDNNGYMIHLTREGADGKVGIPGHSSESGIPFKHTPERNYLFENNDTIEALKEKVLNIFNPILKDKIKPTEF